LLAVGAGALVLAMILAFLGRTRTPMLMVILGALGTGVFAPTGRHMWAASGLLYAGAVLLSSIALRRDPQLGLVALYFLFAVVWVTDILAYFSGRAIGGPRLAPAISPHKTWAGAIGGAVGAVAAGVAVAELAALENIAAIGAIALVLSIAAQAGDLFESAVKRRFGVKDASHAIPGHGGFMDRLDGYAAAATLAAIFGILRAGLDSAAQGLLQW
jgi:phosphatidate cytidylyltransferase